MEYQLITILPLMQLIAIWTVATAQQKFEKTTEKRYLRLTTDNGRVEQSQWSPSRSAIGSRYRVHKNILRNFQGLQYETRSRRHVLKKGCRRCSHLKCHRRRCRKTALSPSPTSRPSLTTGNVCGTTFADAVNRCATACPIGVNSECPSEQRCFADVPCNSLPTLRSEKNYCGTSWGDAGSRCQTACPGGVNSECPSNQKCFASVSCDEPMAPMSTSTSTPSAEKNYCGVTWSDALARCASTCPGGVDTECPFNQKCFASVPCEEPRTPTSIATATPSAEKNYCGVSWSDALAQCASTCPGGVDRECPSGQRCFASVPCEEPLAPSSTTTPTPSAEKNYCGTTWSDALAQCSSTCPGGADSECPLDQKCFASVPCEEPLIPMVTTTLTPAAEKNYCGMTRDDAITRCDSTCPSGVNSECPSGQKCFSSILCDNDGAGTGNGRPEVKGYYEQTWTASTPQADANLAVAFSGHINVNLAKYESDLKLSSLVGAKYISFGGGNANGRWTATAFTSINNAISSGMLKSYDGICYDIEEGDEGLSSAFENSFARAKLNGFKVLVTISHSAPYGISDNIQVMDTVLSSANVDYVSPQLYTVGTEMQNDYATTSGYAWSNYASRQPKIIVSITQTSLFSDAERTFSTYDVSIVGYILWSSTT